MFVELHILQNFAPSNLNRDDTGAPKDCEFGGYRRARISSQCLKRSVRTAFRTEHLVPEPQLAARTKRLVDELVSRLERSGKNASEARQVAKATLTSMGLGLGDENRTQYLLFLGSQEIDAFVAQCVEHWPALLAMAEDGADGSDEGRQPAKRRSSKEAKKAAKATVPAALAGGLERILDGGRAADLALFGRMLADLPDRNIDAASQVAHAISTHRVNTEFDFYTAVDDLKPGETTGADMLGTVEFNSACFYRYSNVDLEQLRRNLGGDEDLARKTLEAFLKASIRAIPTGKQNSMAAQNPPSSVLAIARRSGLWSLANAFLKPVRPTQDGDLAQISLRALDDYWGRMVAMYGDEAVLGVWLCTMDGDGLKHLTDKRLKGVEDLVQGVSSSVVFEARSEASKG